MKFQLGQVGKTRAVADFCEENKIEEIELATLVLKHSIGDWGNLEEEDVVLNNYALENGERLLSSYDFHGETIWIITERDRSSTTILFPSEY